MLYTHVAAGILGAAIASVGAWQVQDWRYDAKIAAIEAMCAKRVTDSLIAAQANFKRVSDASVESEKRAQAARRDSDNAKSELDRLRNVLAASQSCPATAASAAADPAAAYKELFSECAGTLVDLAQKATGHASDVKTLIDGWPR